MVNGRKIQLNTLDTKLGRCNVINDEQVNDC